MISVKRNIAGTTKIGTVTDIPAALKFASAVHLIIQADVHERHMGYSIVDYWYADNNDELFVTIRGNGNELILRYPREVIEEMCISSHICDKNDTDITLMV